MQSSCSSAVTSERASRHCHKHTASARGTHTPTHTRFLCPDNPAGFTAVVAFHASHFPLAAGFGAALQVAAYSTRACCTSTFLLACLFICRPLPLSRTAWLAALVPSSSPRPASVPFMCRAPLLLPLPRLGLTVAHPFSPCVYLLSPMNNTEPLTTTMISGRVRAGGCSLDLRSQETHMFACGRVIIRCANLRHGCKRTTLCSI